MMCVTAMKPGFCLPIAVRLCSSQSSAAAAQPTSTGGSSTRRRRLNPATQATLDSIIRVDHSGELGADRIYAGQMAVLGGSSVGPVIQHMWDQEKVHRAKFEQLIPKHRVRPSVLVPLWNVAGFALGAGCALLGREAAMACTVAVETVITDHYNSQLRELLALPEYEHSEEIRELASVISQFRDEEMEHHDTAIKHEAELAPAYKALNGAVQLGCKGAVWLSKRI